MLFLTCQVSQHRLSQHELKICMAVFPLRHILYPSSSLYLMLLQASPAYSHINSHIFPGQTPKPPWFLVNQCPPLFKSTFFFFYFNRSCLLGFFQSLCLGRSFCPNETPQQAPCSPGDRARVSSQDFHQILTHDSEALVKSLVCSVLCKWLGIQLHFN